MPKGHSPTHFIGEADKFYDPNFTLEMNTKMRVPKNIRISGDYTDQDIIGTNGSTWSHMNNEKCEMNVPERIVVLGQEQHIGTKALPREITLDNAVLPTDTGLIRVKTPPRVLKLDEHYFPAVDEDEHNSFNDAVEVENEPVKQNDHFNTETKIVRHIRETTPSYGTLDVSLAPSEEIQHLRRQVGKLTRRIMAVELQMMQRQQRDKIFYAVSIAYLVLKAVAWLSRN